jgi:peptidoglycan/LPS O-acetylase OafA/YrhL
VAASSAAALTGEPAAAPSPALAPPPGNPRFPLFDGLRGIAVLAILAFHTAEYSPRLGFGPLGRLAEVAGGEAVIVFFVISGFLLYRPYVSAHTTGRPRPATARYARRRALRILPAYWTALTVLAIFPGIIGVFSGHWWRYYGYLQLYRTHDSGGIAVAWTLCVEVTYYVALPLWALLIRRLAAARSAAGVWGAEVWPLGLVVAGGLFVQTIVARRALPYVLGVSLVGQSAWLAVGMLLAVASVAHQHNPDALSGLRRVAARPLLCWAAGLVLCAGLIALVPKGGLFGLIAGVEFPQSAPRTVAKLVLEGLLALAFVLPAVFGPREQGLPRRILAWPPVVGLGVISYSFYLYHLTIVQLLAVADGPRPFSAAGVNVLAHIHVARTVVLYMLSLLVTAVVASISYRLIELPFLRRKESRPQP